MQGVRGIIIAGNEEKHIAGCIKSLEGQVDEVLIYCNGNDSTEEIAASLGATVYRGKWLGYGKSREWILGKAKEGDWCFQIDCDERLVVSDIGLRELAVLGEVRKLYGYSIEIINPTVSRTGEKYIIKDWVFRYFKKVRGLYYDGDVHEQILTAFKDKGLRWDQTGGVKLNHLGYDVTWEEYREKIRRNQVLLLKAEATGKVNGYLYFHMAQGWLAEGEYGKAVVAYERALQMGIYNQSLERKAIYDGYVLSDEPGYFVKEAKRRNLGLPDRGQARKELEKQGFLKGELKGADAQPVGPTTPELSTRPHGTENWYGPIPTEPQHRPGRTHTVRVRQEAEDSWEWGDPQQVQPAPSQGTFGPQAQRTMLDALSAMHVQNPPSQTISEQIRNAGGSIREAEGRLGQHGGCQTNEIYSPPSFAQTETYIPQSTPDPTTRNPSPAERLMMFARRLFRATPSDNMAHQNPTPPQPQADIQPDINSHANRIISISRRGWYNTISQLPASNSNSDLYLSAATNLLRYICNMRGMSDARWFSPAINDALQDAVGLEILNYRGGLHAGSVTERALYERVPFYLYMCLLSFSLNLDYNPYHWNRRPDFNRHFAPSGVVHQSLMGDLIAYRAAYAGRINHINAYNAELFGFYEHVYEYLRPAIGGQGELGAPQQPLQMPEF